MTIKKYVATSDNGNYEFVCESVGTRSGFAHNVTMFRNGYELLKHRVNYLNRTWECWQFQTAIRGAINTLEEREKERAKAMYKSVNNISRLTAKRKLELEERYKTNSRIQACEELLELVRA